MYSPLRLQCSSVSVLDKGLVEQLLVTQLTSLKKKKKNQPTTLLSLRLFSGVLQKGSWRLHVQAGTCLLVQK